MLLSLVVIYLPNLFSCQKSLSEPYCYVVASRPQAARAFLLKVQSPHHGDSTSSRHRLISSRTCQSRNYGGAERDRTVDPLLAKQVLSQLSYSPLIVSIANLIVSITNRRDKVVGLGRFELPTSPLSGVRSNQLSYRPEVAALRAASST